LERFGSLGIFLAEDTDKLPELQPDNSLVFCEEL
jgi:hypothetical protein